MLRCFARNNVHVTDGKRICDMSFYYFYLFAARLAYATAGSLKDKTSCKKNTFYIFISRHFVALSFGLINVTFEQFVTSA